MGSHAAWRAVLSSAFPLVDVTVIADDEIAGHRSMAALTLLQKHIHQQDLAELIDRLTPGFLAECLTFMDAFAPGRILLSMELT